MCPSSVPLPSRLGHQTTDAAPAPATPAWHGTAHQRVVFVNSYASIKHFWITHQAALISRPTFYTFHGVVSSSQGYTIGTSPWDESCKRRRKAAGTALNRPAVASYMPILDLEATASIAELLDDGAAARAGPPGELDPTRYFNRFALNTSLLLNYGFRIEGNVEDALLTEIVEVERVVSNLRSTSNNWQDYVPLLRPFARQNKEAVEYRERRDRYLDLLLDTLKKKIAEGKDKPCITGNILKDPEAKLSHGEYTSCVTDTRSTRTYLDWTDVHGADLPAQPRSSPSV